MPKAPVDWTEDDVLALPPGENDTFERKGARLLDLTLPNVKEGDVLDELAKQLSAFGNTGGGRIVYGVNNAGAVDNGGVARLLKGRQSTREWLEDVIPTLTDYEIVGVNVYEVFRKPNDSALAPDRSFYVVDVPDSDRAPHQSTRDRKYYVRLGGKSHPASHRVVEDIRNRVRHPKLEVQDVLINTATYLGNSQNSSGTLTVYLQLRLQNISKVRARNACLRFSTEVASLSTRPGASTEFSMRPAPEGTALFEVNNPIYPGMGVVLNPAAVFGATLNVVDESLMIAQEKAADVRLSITTFADSAPASEQKFRLGDIDPHEHLDRIRSQEHYRLQQQRAFGSPGPTRTGSWS